MSFAADSDVRARAGPRSVPWLEGIRPAEHGSFDASAAAALGIGPEDVLDFSANGNVVGPSPRVGAAMAGVDVSRYPDRGSAVLRAALAERHGVTPHRIVPGNGSTELIWAVARAFLAPGDRTLVLGPTYGEYAAAAAASGALVMTASVIRPDGGPDANAAAAAVAETSRSVVWLCHPNNPTGTPFRLDLLDDLAGRHPGTLFVVDESYITLTPGLDSALTLDRVNVVVLRSLTKDAALAGIRVGYAIGPPPIAEILRRALPPWSVSAIAQAAALACLEDRDHLTRAAAAVAESRAHLAAGLVRLGYRPYASVANFVLVPVGDGQSLSQRLLARGIAVRDCGSFGLPGCIRIGVRSIPDQERLLGALADIRDG